MTAAGGLSWVGRLQPTPLGVQYPCLSSAVPGFLGRPAMTLGEVLRPQACSGAGRG